MKKKNIVKTKYSISGQEFYSSKNIDKTGALYRIIFGERSNGKSFDVLYKGLLGYIEHGDQLGYIRRWQEDIRPKRAGNLFANFVNNEILGNVIEKLTDGKYNDYKYHLRAYYLIRRDDKGEIVSEDYTPFCFAFCISDWEHDKSIPFPKIKTILFDEMLTRTHYLPDEYSLFNNLLSSIIRNRGDIIIYMVGNTVNYECPYFTEMGLLHVRQMQQGDIDVYTFTDELQVAVEYCKDTSASRPSNKYFAFDNPALKMITNGTWQTDVYPHLSQEDKYERTEVALVWFIEYLQQVIQVNVIDKGNRAFIFMHYKTTPVKFETDILYKMEVDSNPYHFQFMTKPRDCISKKILEIWNKYPKFYQSNAVGEVVRNYLIKCASV